MMNATPMGMLDDARLPLEVASLPRDLIVFDAIVKPERTPLLALAQESGCHTIRRPRDDAGADRPHGGLLRAPRAGALTLGVRCFRCVDGVRADRDLVLRHRYIERRWVPAFAGTTVELSPRGTTVELSRGRRLSFRGTRSRLIGDDRRPRYTRDSLPMRKR